jgi:hypothetical protein
MHGMQCLFDPWIQDPEWFFPDLGSWIPTPFFSPLSFVAVSDQGFGMAKNQDPGSGIKIPDPQHWYKLS